VSPATKSEEWFERYLADRGCDWRYEQDLGVEKRPDYLVRCDGLEVVCEVEELGVLPAVARRPGRIFALSPHEEFGAVREKIRAAARQLKPLDGRDWPLVAVVADPHAYGHALGADDLIYAMYGNPAVSVPIEGAASEPVFFAGRDGRLTNDHPYISGVAALRIDDESSRWYQERIFQLRHAASSQSEFSQLVAGITPADAPDPRFRIVLVESQSAIEGRTARVPRRVFDADTDEWWAPDRDGRYSPAR
jgi:hypothetical protein